MTAELRALVRQLVRRIDSDENEHGGLIHRDTLRIVSLTRIALDREERAQPVTQPEPERRHEDGTDAVH